MNGMTDERMTGQLQRWRDELIDLTRRNRLLKAAPNKASIVEITEPSLATVLGRLESAEGWRFHYPPHEIDSTDDAVLRALAAEDPDLDDEIRFDELVTHITSATQLSRVLHNLERRASQEFLDKGLRVLYLGVGALDWIDGDGERLLSPVVLLPVELSRPNPRAPFRLRSAEEDAVANPALIVKLARDHAVDIPAFLADNSVGAHLAAVASAVANIPNATVTERILLSFYTFQKEAMYQDLLANEATIAQHAGVRALSLGPLSDSDFTFDPIPDDRLDELAPPEQLVSIRDADATQRACIAAAAAQRSFVMDGPPGTGKSQTIANIIAEVLHQGRTVLFVSEKAAALEVVKSRLDDVQLGHFVLELHSHKATRKEVAGSLGTALSERPRAKQVMTSTEIAQVQKHRKNLSDYARALNERREPLGQSLFDMLGDWASLDSAPIAPLPESIGTELQPSALADVVENAAALANAWGPVEQGDEFLWRDLADSADATLRSNEISRRLHDSIAALQKLANRAEDIALDLALDVPESLDEIGNLIRLIRMIESRPLLAPHWLTTNDRQDIETRISELEWAQYQRDELTTELDQLWTSWDEIDPQWASRWNIAASRLADIKPPVGFDGSNAVQALVGLPDRLRVVSVELIDAERTARELAARLGATMNMDPDVAEIRRVLELGSLGLSAHRPDARWFSAENAGLARSAAAILRPIVDDYRRLQAQLVTHFNEHLQNVDIEAMYENETATEAQLGRLSSSGRRNRAALGSCTKSGKIDAETKQLLGAARSSQRLRIQLDGLELDRALDLASYYGSREAVDWFSVDAALNVADQVLKLVSGGGDMRVLGEHLGVQAADAHELGNRAKTAIGDLEQCCTIADDLLGGAFGAAVRRPLSSLLEWLEEVSQEATPIDEIAAAALALTDRPRSINELTTTLLRCLELRDLFHDFEGRQEQDLALFGGQFDGLLTPISKLRDAIEWSAAIMAALGGPVEEYTATRILESSVNGDEIEQFANSAEKQLLSVTSLFEAKYGSEIAADFWVSIAAAIALLEELTGTIGDISEWTAFVAARSRLTELGLGEASEFCIVNRLLSTQVVPVIRRAILSAWIDSAFANDARIQPVRAVDRGRLIGEFRRLDSMLRSDAAARVINSCSARRPSTTIGAAAVIKREAEKKTRHMPIRELLTKAGEVAQACKPCFMMSPLSVSQFLPSDLIFDIVIFDEASQVRPCDAINSVYRGRQLIIAGDEKQLPPTSFFARVANEDDDEWNEEQFDDFSSLLELAKGSGRIPSLPLQWHYRSSHESLITYSNYSFYDGKLVTYPGALETGDGVGVRLHQVPNGVYARGGARDNTIEARVVVERVLWFAENQPTLSVGVVALSEAQASRIEYELDFARQGRPDLDEWFTSDRLNGFFIKNLENVQGDERDVILLSIGYGRDEVGKLTMHFGPINTQSGPRRLNVAVTRARKCIEVISSITAGDIVATGSEGVAHLKRYLDYAQRGVGALSVEIGDHRSDAESPFEEEVLRTVRSWAYDAVPQVGDAGYRIDLAIRHPEYPGRFAIGIECDGAAYHSSKVARDRDRLRQEVLENLGWTLHRIWGPAWYRGRPSEEARLRNAIEAAIAGRSVAPAQTVVEMGIEVDVDTHDFSAPPPWTRPYVLARLQFKPRLTMDDPASSGDLERVMVAVIDVEGPIVKALLVERVRTVWGAARMGAKMQGAFDGVLDQLVRRKAVTKVERDGYVTQKSSVDIVRMPTDDPATRRSVAQIPAVEFELAISLLIGDSHLPDVVELETGVARIFGWQRRGTDIQAAFNRAMSALQGRGEIELR